MVDKLELNKEDPQVTKAVESKDEPKTAAKTIEEPKPAAEVKEEPKATAKSKDEPKPAAKKTGYLSEIDGVEVDFELQYRDRETDMKDIAKRVTEDYVNRGNDPATIELIHVYLKPTDFTAYYVINNSYEGKIPLF